MKYDVFISYRREGGYDTAKHIYDLLVRDGYNVSFDIDTLRNGDFDTQLLTRIEQCKDFILIVDKNCFDRTLDGSTEPNQDWLRCELAYALKLKKNIIPVFLAGVSGFPDNLPADVAGVTKKNGPEFSRYYFDDFYEDLCTRFLKSRKKHYVAFTISLVILIVLSVIVWLCVKGEKDIYYIDPYTPHTTTTDDFVNLLSEELNNEIKKSGFEQYDFKHVQQEWKDFAVDGDAEYQWKLGLLYYDGYGEEPNIRKAIRWFKKAAKQDHAKALYAIGGCYEHEIGVKHDLEYAKSMYKQSAELGLARAQYDYAVSIYSIKESVKWLNKAAEQNFAPAKYALAYCYSNGMGVERDIDAFIYWLEEAADHDYDIALCALASIYLTGPEEYQDQYEAICILEDLVEENNVYAQINLAFCYCNGLGVDLDMEKSIELMKKAAEQESAEALTLLGYWYLEPPTDFIAQDFNEGIKLLKRAAEQGYPIAQYYLGQAYQSGYGVDRDKRKAKKWFDKAAMQGVTHQNFNNNNRNNNNQ